MIIAIHIHPDITDMEIPAVSENGKQFAIIKGNGTAESLHIDATNKKDIARSLIADNIDVLITHDISLEAFVLLKSYGVRVYAAMMEPMSLSAILEHFEEGALAEITPENYAVFHKDAASVGTSYENRTADMSR